MTQPGMPELPAGAIRKRNVYDVMDVLKAQKPAGPRNILVRVDFNVPMDAEGNITDDSRITGALPTIRAIIENGCNAILVSHMGRPSLVQKGADDEETAKERKALTLEPIATYLSGLVGKPVLFGPDVLKSHDTVQQLPAEGGALCLLENVRFYKAEEKNDPDFAKALSEYADGYVNDAFGTAHRAHGSTAGVPAIMPKEVCGIGCLMASELAYLDFSTKAETDKIAAIIGGSKVSTKLPVIKGLLNSVDVLVLGGGLAFTFLKALGVTIGTSLLEEDMIGTAKEIMEQAEKEGKEILLPVDSVTTEAFPSGPMDEKDTQVFDMVPGGGIPDGRMGLDCGPKTIAKFEGSLGTCTKICFNGPMGVFEIPPFDKGTRALVDVLASLTEKGCVTVVGGGDSVAAVKTFGKMEAVSYVSTGGGATLELLAGDKLPGVEIIENFA